MYINPIPITTGTTAAIPNAYGGTWRVSENSRSSEDPKIMPSRP